MRRLIASALAAVFGFFGFVLIDASIENRVETLESQVMSLEARLDDWYDVWLEFSSTTQPPPTTVARSVHILGGTRTVTVGDTIGFTAVAMPSNAVVQWRIVAGNEFVTLHSTAGVTTTITATTTGAARLEASIAGETAGASRIVATVDIIINP